MSTHHAAGAAAAAACSAAPGGGGGDPAGRGRRAAGAGARRPSEVARMGARVTAAAPVAGIIFAGARGAAARLVARLGEGEHALPDAADALVRLAHKGRPRAP